MNTQIIINLKIENVINSDCSTSQINIDKIIITPKLEEELKDKEHIVDITSIPGK